jgi:predicted O-methyltransferase YrrM
MPIIARLAALYENRDIHIATGLNPSHFDNYPLAPFTWFFKDGENLTNGLGISIQEIYFLECLFARFRPKAVFAIGNSLGWSTLALALANPDARVLAIDAATDRLALEGIRFTNSIAKEEGLPVTVVAGSSPGDVAKIFRDQAMPPIDFAFIDGYHSVEQVVLDFDAVSKVAAPGCVYLFHDVESFALTPGVERIAAESGMSWHLLLGTTSGMAIVYDDRSPLDLADIAPFAVSAEAVSAVRDAAWAHHHRHLARWRKSLRKRLGPRPAPSPAGSERNRDLLGLPRLPKQ